MSEEKEEEMPELDPEEERKQTEGPADQLKKDLNQVQTDLHAVSKKVKDQMSLLSIDEIKYLRDNPDYLRDYCLNFPVAL